MENSINENSCWDPHAQRLHCRLSISCSHRCEWLTSRRGSSVTNNNPRHQKRAKTTERPAPIPNDLIARLRVFALQLQHASKSFGQGQAT